MAFGYRTRDGERLIVYTERKELGHSKGKRGNWWALRAFGAIADSQEELDKDYEGREGYLDKWVFPISCELAVKRILDERVRQFTLLPEKESTERLERLRKKSDD